MSSALQKILKTQVAILEVSLERRIDFLIKSTRRGKPWAPGPLAKTSSIQKHAIRGP